MTIADNIAQVREQMAAATRRAGRRPEDVMLMGVSKTFPAAAIREAYAAGLRVFGENRVQEFGEKAAGLADLGDAEWHLIGHLQSNKASKAVEIFHAVDSVDSVRLAEKLNAAAAKAGRKLAMLIEVNIGGEEAKSGLAAGSSEFEQLLKAAERLEHLELRGLMTIPPFTENPEDARPFFRRLRQFRDATAMRRLPGVRMETLSMGMSHDFEVAIEEGSTCVRVGTAIFGRRDKDITTKDTKKHESKFLRDSAAPW
jgi:pyridoxal phosphate enzyme (YggS family)